MRFEFDPQKSKLNKKKHGIDLSKVTGLWDSTHVIIPAKNVEGESRNAIIGTLAGKIFVAI